MEDKIIRMVFDKLGDSNLYNFDNDEKLKNVKDIQLYTNLLGELVIDIVLEHETYTITCFKSYADEEVECANKNRK